jgi:hypothetical protein
LNLNPGSGQSIAAFNHWPGLWETTAGNIFDTPSSPGTYHFTLQGADQIGATEQEKPHRQRG